MNSEEEPLQETLDALEEMIAQHCYVGSTTSYCDMALSANEYACDVLARHRPEQWRRTNRGIDRIQ